MWRSPCRAPRQQVRRRVPVPPLPREVDRPAPVFRRQVRIRAAVQKDVDERDGAVLRGGVERRTPGVLETRLMVLAPRL